jgi:hypothetical protein
VLRPELGTLVEMADQQAKTDPSTSALYFKPHLMHDCRCRSSPCSNFSSPPHLPPRLGQWLHGSEGPPFEGKLIMNTKAIGMFFVHYLTMIEKGKWNERAYQVPISDGALLHFRVPSVRSGSIYGAMLRKITSMDKSLLDLQKMESYEEVDINSDNVLESSVAANDKRRNEPLAVCRHIFMKESNNDKHGRYRSNGGVEITRHMHDIFISGRLDKLQSAYVSESKWHPG